ncbi:MAG: RNA polymerase sigma factor [Planctomycetota bacterium]
MEALLDRTRNRPRSGTGWTPESLVERHFMDVYAVCLGHLGHPQDAEDATQETFAAVFRDWGKLEDVASVPAWLTTVARNKAVSMLRRRGRTKPLTGDVADAPPIGGPLDRDRFDAALAGLSESDRRLVVLRFVEGKSAKEIAAETGKDAGAARTALCRAVMRLRHLYHGRSR